MTKKQIERHEEKNRKGKYKSKGWRDDFDAMAKKTVLRRLISKYGLMSIDYRMDAGRQEVAMAQAIALGDFSEVATPVIPEDSYVVDGDTGELMGEGSTEESLQQENSSVGA